MRNSFNLFRWANIAAALQTSDDTTKSSVLEQTIKRLELPNKVQRDVEQTPLSRAVIFVRDGAFLSKYPRITLARKSHIRMFKLDMDALALKWLSPAKKAERTMMDLSDVQQFRVGTQSAFFNGRRYAERELGIELQSSHRHLRLVCPTYAEWLLWTLGIAYGIAKAEVKKKRMSIMQKEDFYKRLWHIADHDDSGSVAFKQVLDVLQRINFPADLRYVAYVFSVEDQTSANSIDYMEFRELMAVLLLSPSLHDHFLPYLDADGILKTESVTNFLQDVQKASSLQAQKDAKIIFTAHIAIRTPQGISEAGFSMLLRSQWNSIVDSDRLTHDQDMSRPIHQYWINSTHDPFPTQQNFLLGLRRTLLRSVRFLTFFIKPHQNRLYVFKRFTSTQVKHCHLSTVLSTCKDYAFRTTPYPLIIMMYLATSDISSAVARLLRTHLGPLLYKYAANKVPPIEALMKKILVAGCTELPDSLMQDQLLSNLESSSQTGRKSSLAAGNIMRSLSVPPSFSKTAKEREVRRSLSCYDVDAELIGDDGDFANLLAFHVRRFGDPTSDSGVPTLYAMTFDQLVQQSPSGSIDGSSNCTYVYPDGIIEARVNRGFCSALAEGVHFIALSDSRPSIATLMRDAFFSIYGNCGYVPKPFCAPASTLRQERRLRQERSPPMQLTITVLEGCQLPRGPVNDPPDDTLSPLVAVSVRGLARDCVCYTTKACFNNGLNPLWRSCNEFTFTVTDPSISFLVFETKHLDVGGGLSPLANAAVLISTVRAGVRWVQLTDTAGHKLNASGLLVKVVLSLKKDGHQPRNPRTPVAGGRQRKMSQPNPFNIS